jgi:uncharacterized protein YbjT (DUF2867 family)
MNILITGATGFIGRRLTSALRAAGHTVVGAARTTADLQGCSRVIRVDYSTDISPDIWRQRLVGIDMVINAVGILRESKTQSFAALHTQAPIALFTAAMQLNVKRVIQISALGATADAQSGYHLSKYAADQFLATWSGDWIIAQPSLVYGPGGTSARLFNTLASLPIIPLPQLESQLQPIHIDDLIDALVALTESPVVQTRIALVGPKRMHLAEFLATLRKSMGLGKARFIRIPHVVMNLAVAIGSRLRGSLLDRETIAMLRAGSVADAADTTDLIGRPLTSADEFVQPTERQTAKLTWLLPILRYSIALMWIVTAFVSVFAYPTHESYRLLERVGVAAAIAPFALYGAAVLDLALGVGVLVLQKRRWLWLLQAVLVLFYSVVIAMRLPEFWAHPYGPLLKNIPMLVAIWLLYELEDR